MHSFDPELLASLAEGTLAPAEAAALEARIAGDPAAAADLAGQRAALAAIRGAPSPRLDERERIALNAAVAGQLGLTADGTALAPRSRRRMAWGPIAVAATTLVAIVALAPTVADIAGKDDEAAITADGATTTVATADLEFDAAPLDARPPEPTLAATDATDGGDLGAGDAYATTTLGAAMTERAAYLPVVAEDLMLLKSDPEALNMLERPIDDTTACVAEATEFLGGPELTTFAYPMESTDPASDPVTYVVFRLAPADGDGPGTLVAFDPADCSTPIAVP
jgi:hypothetical protein